MIIEKGLRNSFDKICELIIELSVINIFHLDSRTCKSDNDEVDAATKNSSGFLF